MRIVDSLVWAFGGWDIFKFFLLSPWNFPFTAFGGGFIWPLSTGVSLYWGGWGVGGFPSFPFISLHIWVPFCPTIEGRWRESWKARDPVSIKIIVI